MLRVYVADDPQVFRVVAAGVLLPLGLSILWRRKPPESPRVDAARIAPRTITLLALPVGVVGGIYGVGGGSILGPILVGTGMSLAVVAPAALASTFVTSIGVGLYAALSVNAPGTIAPDWSLGIACGLGGLAGGYVGARSQRHLPERLLRSMLGLLAIGLALLYVAQTVG